MKTNTKGFTLIEVLVYTAVLASMIGLFGYVLVRVYEVSDTTRHGFVSDRHGVSLIDRILYEIRTAVSFDTEESEMGVDEGKLVLQTIDEDEEGQVIIELQDGRVVFTKDGEVVYTTPEDIYVRELVFAPVMSGTSTEALRLSVGIEWDTKGTSMIRRYTGLESIRTAYE